MPYSRAPAWRYFPLSDAPPPPLVEAAAAFADLSGWFKTSFWPPIDAATAKMNTKTITQRLEGYLKPDAQQLHRGDGLRAEWNVETRDDYQRIPLLYGENGKELYGVEPDAIHETAVGGHWALLEIDGGGAVQDNRLIKDIVETLLSRRRVT